MSNDDEITKQEAKAWAERPEGDRLVDEIRKDQETFPTYKLHILIPTFAHAEELAKAVNDQATGTEALVTPSGAVEIHLQRAMVLGVAILVQGHGGVYDGRP